MRSISDLLSSITKPRGAAARAEPSLRGVAPSTAYQLPAYDVGFPTSSPDELLEPHAELLDRIHLAYGCDGEAFQRDIVGVVRRYAAFVHLLPATPDNFFRESGGLLRMGLEIGFFALQGTDSHIFSGRENITHRFHLEPRWRYATFLAGLLSEVHRSLSQVIVTSDDGGDWPGYLCSLAEWTQTNHFARYYIRWTQRTPETRAVGLLAVPHIVPADKLRWLADGNAAVVPDMLAAIGGLPSYRDPNVIDGLVRRCMAVVIDRDLRSSADRYGRPIQGSHLERYLVDAMRRLVASHAWQINGEKSRLWHGSDGLFLVWPNSAVDIVRLLVEKDYLPGIPKSAETLAEILSVAGVFERRPDNELAWQILPPQASAPITAVKFTSPDILSSALDVPLPALNQPLIFSGRLPAPPGPVSADSRAEVASLLNGTVARSMEPDGDDEEGDSSARSVDGRIAGVTEPAPAAPLGAASGSVHLGGVAVGGGAGGGGAPATASPSQLDLLSAPAQGPIGPRGAPRFALHSTLSVPSGVRRSLEAIVDSLNGPSSSAACCTVPYGVFVPLASLSQFGSDPGAALRALSEARMIVAPQGGGKTVRHSFGGADELGFVLNPRFVSGLDLAHFDALET